MQDVRQQHEQQYEENGYAIIPDVIDPALTEEMRGHIAWRCSRPTTS